ncbi:MAG: hypothetical protein IPO76_08085 [Elusimicrobia bacterium]|nr:hypothetical protein [Elusimicrobiota bacterium]MBK7545695.1 hypothetical protein [Elusimicrobiota bacterium]MBK7574958.1 hypothetical protein [Elusimicrobiota bacterium]MBK7687775.1 hypothetical protein [Elusimicrobiota bacterium]MBK8125304.1 hypothetical protein [Elusimicrobiota bacterium]
MSDASAPLRAARLFEFYVHRVWPLHRLWAGRRLSRRCRRCALSERAAPLDAEGLCAPCRAPSGPTAPPPDDTPRLNEIISAHAGRGTGPHDALVLFSGGKDSVYMIRRLRDEHPRLRLLAFTHDNTFMSPVARDNIDRLVRRLDLDHVTLRPTRAFMKKLFRYGLTHLNENGGYGTVDFSDGELLLDTARGLAAEKGIPLILCGYSRLQVEGGLGLRGFESPAERERSDRTHVAGLPLKDIFGPEDPHPWWRGSRWPADRVARLLFPLAAWNLDESAVRDQVAAWGLLSPRQNSPVVTNHQLIPLLGVVDVHQRGYSGFEIEFCRMIREGKAPYAHWRRVFEFLEHTSRTGLFLKPAVIETLRALDLSAAEVGINFHP